MNNIDITDIVLNLSNDDAVHYFKKLAGRQLTLSDVIRNINVQCEEKCSSMNGYIVLVQYPLKLAVKYSGDESVFKRELAQVDSNQKLTEPTTDLCILIKLLVFLCRVSMKSHNDLWLNPTHKEFSY